MDSPGVDASAGRFAPARKDPRGSCESARHTKESARRSLPNHCFGPIFDNLSSAFPRAPWERAPQTLASCAGYRYGVTTSPVAGKHSVLLLRCDVERCNAGRFTGLGGLCISAGMHAVRCRAPVGTCWNLPRPKRPTIQSRQLVCPSVVAENRDPPNAY